MGIETKSKGHNVYRIFHTWTGKPMSMWVCVSCSARESFFGMGSPLSAGIPPPNALKGKSSFIFLQINNFAWFWYKSTVSKLFWTDWPQIWPKIRNYFILSLYLKSLIFVQIFLILCAKIVKFAWIFHSELHQIIEF